MEHYIKKKEKRVRRRKRYTKYCVHRIHAGIYKKGEK